MMLLQPYQKLSRSKLMTLSQPDERITLDKRKRGTENRRGSSKRKSHTVEFKKQTLDLLNSLANSKNK